MSSACVPLVSLSLFLLFSAPFGTIPPRYVSTHSRRRCRWLFPKLKAYDVPDTFSASQVLLPDVAVTGGMVYVPILV